METITIVKGQFAKWSVCPNTEYERTGYLLHLLTHYDLRRCRKAGLNLRTYPNGMVTIGVKPMILTAYDHTTHIDKELEKKFVGKIFENIQLQIYRHELDGCPFTSVYFNPLEL